MSHKLVPNTNAAFLFWMAVEMCCIKARGACQLLYKILINCYYTETKVNLLKWCKKQKLC